MNEALNAATLRDMLAKILAVDPSYVVPRQGTWWNPQLDPSLLATPRTWCAYRIEADGPLDAPFYADEEESGDRVNLSVARRVARVALQFVGPDAEEWARGTAHWLMRQDVADQLDRVGGRLFGAPSDVSSVDFYQDGANTVIAYTVRLRVAWVSEIVADQPIVRGAQFEGEVIV